MYGPGLEGSTLSLCGSCARNPSFFHGVTTHRCGPGLDRERQFHAAALVRERAARVERTAGRRIDRIRNLALDRFALAAREVEVGHRIEQHARVGMLRRAGKADRRAAGATPRIQLARR